MQINEKYKQAPIKFYRNPDGTIYYHPREGETPENIEAYIPITESLFSFNGCNNITFYNIHF